MGSTLDALMVTSQNRSSSAVFFWYRSVRLIDLRAVGGNGGHFSPEYFDSLLIPRFPDDLTTIRL